MTLSARFNLCRVPFYRSKQILDQSKMDFQFRYKYLFQMVKFGNELCFWTWSKWKNYFGPKEGQGISPSSYADTVNVSK